MLQRILCRVFLPVLIGSAIVSCLEGCSAYEHPKTPDEAIHVCLDEARDAYYDGGVSKNDAQAIFKECMKRHGFEPTPKRTGARLGEH